MMREDRLPPPSATARLVARTITAKKPNDLWRVDLTTVPTALGFWIPWLPFALPGRRSTSPGVPGTRTSGQCRPGPSLWSCGTVTTTRAGVAFPEASVAM
jgi:hypothetical protein